MKTVVINLEFIKKLTQASLTIRIPHPGYIHIHRYKLDHTHGKLDTHLEQISLIAGQVMRNQCKQPLRVTSRCRFKGVLERYDGLFQSSPDRLAKHEPVATIRHIFSVHEMSKVR